jgi:hypothetical protein
LSPRTTTPELAAITWLASRDPTTAGLLASNWQNGVGGPLLVGGDPEQEFLDGIDKLGLSEKEAASLLELLINAPLPML